MAHLIMTNQCYIVRGTALQTVLIAMAMATITTTTIVIKTVTVITTIMGQHLNRRNIENAQYI